MRRPPHAFAGLKTEKAKQEGMWVASRSREPPPADSQQGPELCQQLEGSLELDFFPASSIRTWTNETLILDLWHLK